jgi:hypothetical protein
MPAFPLVRVRSRHLSLWQSVVAEQAKQDLGGEPSREELLSHPRVVAASTHVQAAHAGRTLAPGDDDQTRAYLSQLGFEKAIALIEGDAERAAAIDVQFRPFSDDDKMFLGCAVTYAFYDKLYNGMMKYNDWVVVGHSDPNYAVINWTLPNDAVVGIIGDWGTGLPDAAALLTDLMRNHNPAAIIHLGDIYYSGTPTECQTAYASVFTDVFNATLGQGKRIPVFTLAGNHDYYAFGYGFYAMFNGINNAIAGAGQVATYFSLRTADDGWQFLAMDTGLNDSDPADQIDPWYAGPSLQPSEVQWLQLQLRRFPGATVLLSHHQLFSANAKLNGMLSPYSDLPYLNPYLVNAFLPYFTTDVAAWLWGHEHNFVLYENGLFGLAKGRLIGCSAYEELVSANPYKVNYDEVPYLDPTKYQLGSDAGYYNHGYAVIDLSRRSQPTDPISIQYYQFPSWYGTPASSPQSQFIYGETFTKPTPSQPVSYGTPIRLFAQEGFYIGPLYSQGQYYPTALGDAAATLTLSGSSSGTIRHGDTVQIKTTEAAAGTYNILGAWSTPALYYYTPGYTQQQWTIQKRDPTVPEVRYGDEVAFVNKSYSGQSMQPYWSTLWQGRYLTTKSGAPYYWTIPSPYVPPADKVGQMWHTIRNPDGSWVPQFGLVETQEQNDPSPFGDVACGGVDGTLEVVGLPYDGLMWHTLRNPDGSWVPQFGLVESQEQNDPGPFLSAASAGVGDALHVVAVSQATGQLWHTIRNADGTWQSAYGLIESQEQNDPGPFIAVGCGGAGTDLQVVALDRNGQMWHTIRNADGTWTPEFGLVESQEQNDPGPFTAVACAGVGDTLHVVGLSQDGQLWHTIRNADGTWQSTYGLIESQEQNDPGQFTDVACGGVGDTLQVVGLSLDGRLWHTLRNPDGSWVPQFGLIESVEQNDPGVFTAVSCAGVGDALQVVGVA